MSPPAICPKTSSRAKRCKLDILQDQENYLMDDDNEFRLLPELLKMILTKAVLVQMYSEDTTKLENDESIFSNLAPVNFLWWSSMKNYNLKNKIRHLSKVYFQKAKMRSTIIRNNRNFLKEVIHPDKIIFPMESCGCLTEGQVRFLNRLRNHKDKNHELLIMLQDFSSQKYSKMIECLFLENQTPAALVLERGGEAVKVHINNGEATRMKEFEMEFIERFQRMQTENTLILDDLLNASVRKRLKDVFVLHAKQNKGIELWLWCKTEFSLNQLKNLSGDDLREIIQPICQRLIPNHKMLKPQIIQMSSSLGSDFAERRLSIRHVTDHDNLSGGRAVLRRFRYSKCITSLADKIYVAHKQMILVYENKYPYPALEPIVISHVGLPVSIASCNISKCLYASFFGSDHICKVEPELDNKVSQWLSKPGLLSVSVTSKGDVLVLQVVSGNDMLLMFTPEGAFKRNISMECRLGRIKLFHEIIPGIVALSDAFSYIAIMRLDDNGTILRNIEWQQEIVSLTSFRYGDLLIGTIGCNDDDLSDDFGVQLHQWPFELKVARDLLTTDDTIDCIHFVAERKQLFVLFENKLQIYELNYEDEDCCP